jgi:hypothetical protein
VAKGRQAGGSMTEHYTELVQLFNCSRQVEIFKGSLAASGP